MTDTNEKVDQFFERYASALLARDAKAMAGMYAVPSLILFPGTSIPVSDANQTEEFFASSWGQYEGVDAAIQVHGGNGFAAEYGIAGLWWMARLLRTAPVSREMILNYVAEHSLRLPRSY